MSRPGSQIYDAIVVGAGPSGSTLALELAQLGHDVLLLDRESFPRDKACGDGVPPGTVELLTELGLGEALASAGFYEVTGITLGSPYGRVWETGCRGKRAHFISRRVVCSTRSFNRARLPRVSTFVSRPFGVSRKTVRDIRGERRRKGTSTEVV